MSSVTDFAAAPAAPAGHVDDGPLPAKPPKSPATRRSRTFGPLLRWSSVAVGIISVSAVGYRYASSHVVPAVRYQTVTVDRGPLAARVTASGTVSAIVTVQVGSQVSGRIEHWYSDFSSPVKRGQLIASIEPSLFRAAVDQAKANFASAKAAYDKALANRLQAERSYSRALALFELNLAARADLDLAEAQASSSRADVEAADAAMQQTRAALAQALLNLSYTRIVSPIDGIVISRNIDVGQTVAASFQAPTLFTIAQDLTKMQVDTNVAEGDVGKIRENMEATFTVDAYPSRVFRGAVRQVRDNATTIQNVVTYDAVVDVDNSDLALRPTMTANCTFQYASKEDALRIPNAALRFKPDTSTIAAMTGMPTTASPLGPDQRLVWVLSAGRAEPRVIRAGIGDGMVTEVLEGALRAGETPITEAMLTGAPRKGP